MTRRIVLTSISLLLLCAVVAALVYGPRVNTMLQVGVGYVARHMCACQMIANRSEESCRADLLPEMARIRSESLANRAGTRASAIGGWFERVAIYQPGSGCTLQ